MASVLLYSGLNPQIIEGQEGATSGSFAAGDLIKTDSGGQWVLAATGVCHGIAKTGFTGTQGTKFSVELLDPSSVYVMHHKAAALNQNMVGLACDLVYTYSAQNVDTAVNTHKEVTVVGLHPNDIASLPSGGRLLIRFNLANCDPR